MHISAFICSERASRGATDCHTRVSAFSVLRFVPASLFRRQETCGADWDYGARETGAFLTSCDSMLMGRNSWIGPILTLRDCQSCGGPKVPANAVSDPCDAFVMVRKRWRIFILGKSTESVVHGPPQGLDCLARESYQTPIHKRLAHTRLER